MIESCRAAKLTLRSFVSRRTGFVLFFRRASEWHAFTRGTAFPVRGPSIDELDYFRHFVPRRGGTVFDIGGEKGQQTRQFAKITGPAGRVYVFECYPPHLEGLHDIARKHPQVVVVDRACWDCDGRLNFFAGHTPGSNTAVPGARGQRGQELADPARPPLSVAAERLDSLWHRLAGRQPVDFLKMDIEGAELEALAGATEVLRHTRQAVIAAYHRRDGVPTAGRVAEVLRRAGFAVRVDENLHVYATRGN